MEEETLSWEHPAIVEDMDRENNKQERKDELEGRGKMKRRERKGEKLSIKIQRRRDKILKA